MIQERAKAQSQPSAAEWYPIDDAPPVAPIDAGCRDGEPRRTIALTAATIEESEWRYVRAMALTATVYHFQIELSDVDRGVYESLDLRVARHPSESTPYLLTRVIAYALLFEDGIAFSKGGLSDTDEAPLSVKDLQGNVRVWVEIGTPSADRLHKVSKASPQVVVFTQHDPRLLVREAQTRPIYKAERIEVYALEPAFLDRLGALTDRNARWTVLRNDGQLYVTVGAETVSGAITRHTLAEGAS
jgi:uncharacterized protein YaeQ